MRWDRFFDDLEDQLASEWEAERAALDTEAERLRISRVTLKERLTSLVGRDRGAGSVAFEFADGVIVRAEVTRVGADWVGLEPAEGPPAALIAPIASITSVGMTHPDVLRTARPAPARTELADRMTFGFVLRDLVRRRVGVTVQLAHGRSLTGTIDRAGADHLDIALHEAGSPRRAGDVSGHRLVAFDAIARVRVDGGAAFA